MFQSLMEIRENFLIFQLTHVPKCTFIPTDIRESYDKYTSHDYDVKHYEKYRGCGEKDFCPLVWKTSAIRRGLRDAHCGETGIVYHPGLLNHQNNTDDKEDGDDVSVYGDEKELEQTIFDLMKELHDDTFTPIMKVYNHQEIVSIKSDVDMEDTAVTLNNENLVSEDSVESTVRQEKSNYVVEEEDSLLAVSGNSDGPGKKQKFDNEVSDVDSVSILAMSIFTLLS